MERLKDLARALIAVAPPRSILPSVRRVIAIHTEIESAMAALQAYGWTIDQADAATQEALQDEIDFVRSTVYPFSLERLRQRLRVHQDRAASGELPTPDPPG